MVDKITFLLLIDLEIPMDVYTLNLKKKVECSLGY
jgi:hypothetical protein